MSRSTHDEIVRLVLDEYGQTYADELGIDLAKGTPSRLFRWLCAALLMSARIRVGSALAAARALAEQGWTTAEKMAASSWEERTRTLNRAGYARYDESTSRMLGETSRLLLDSYRGDLRRLRAKAGQEPACERRLLKAFKGMGEVGVDIFCREVQIAWPEFYPFADRKALQAAARLGLDDDAQTLAHRVSRHDFPRLVTGLVRVSLADAFDRILQHNQTAG